MALFDKIKGFFRKKGKPLPKRYGSKEKGAGHRGVAIGSLKNKNLSAENIAKWDMLSGDEVERFLYDGELLVVHSTHVAAAQYHYDEKKLMIEYHDGSAYLYSPITLEKAEGFAKAFSKGSWCWDELRVRGPGGDSLPAPGITVTQIRQGRGAQTRAHPGGIRK